MTRPYSISRRLIWVLSLSQILALTLCALGIYVSIHLILQANNDNKPEAIAPALIGALTQSPDGALEWKPTPELRALAIENTRFWAGAQTRDGRTLVFGQPPPELLPVLFTLSRSATGFLQPKDPRAGMAFVLSPVESPELGPVNLVYGDLTPHKKVFWGIPDFFKAIFVPLLIATALTPIVVVPMVVRRIMSGLAGATQAAQGIRFGAVGERLPMDNVPAEVASLVKAVNDALERLDTGQVQRQQFLTDAAHELRTPIAILLTRLEGMPPSADNDRLMADVERLAEMAEQLLDVQRLDRMAEMQDGIELGQLARKVASELAPMAIAAGYQLSFSGEAAPQLIRGDAPSLERALANLIRNAIEHGGGRGEIEVSVKADRTIEVSDEGPGVPANQRDAIFQPFHRLHPRSKGAGMGLTLVRQIVHRHSGEVTLLETPRGARFRMAFGQA